MAKKKSTREIIAESLPDLEIAKPSPSSTDDISRSDTTEGASIEELRAKYGGRTPPTLDDTTHSAAGRIVDLRRRFLGMKGSSAAEGKDIKDSTALEDDVDVVQVRPKVSPTDPLDDPGPRTVIVSKSKGIIGSQG